MTQTPDLAQLLAQCRERASLLKIAHDLIEDADRQKENWARTVLLTMAGHCTAAVEVFTLDPTLLTEPVASPWFRGLDLLAKQARQCRGACRRAVAGAPTRLQAQYPNYQQNNRDEAEAWVTSAGLLATAILAELPRPTDTTEGMLQVSRMRLAGQHDLVKQAARLLARAAAAAMTVDKHDPRTGYLAQTSVNLTAIANTLADEYTTEVDRLNTALGFQP
jgi:hypothetical protein